MAGWGYYFGFGSQGRPLQEGDTRIKLEQRKGTRLAKIFLIGRTRTRTRTQSMQKSLNDSSNNNSGMVVSVANPYVALIM